VPILLDDTKLPDSLRSFHWIDLRKPEPHGGLGDFVYRTFRHSSRHYYPKDERGDYHDWDYENFIARELARKKDWEAAQTMLSLGDVYLAHSNSRLNYANHRSPARGYEKFRSAITRIIAVLQKLRKVRSRLRCDRGVPLSFFRVSACGTPE
jgi:hypothetical protein